MPRTRRGRSGGARNSDPGLIGQITGGIGNAASAVGRGIGNAASGLGSLLSGTPDEIRQAQLLTPQQQSFQNLNLQQAQQLLPQLVQLLSAQQQQPQMAQYQGQHPMQFQAPASNLSFEPFAAEARRGFQEQTVPSLAERFTAMGGGAGSSSAFQGALARAGTSLESQLAALGSKFGLAKEQLANQRLGTLAPLQAQYQGQQQNLQQQQLNMQQALQQLPFEQRIRLLSLLSGQGMGQSFQPYHQQGSPGLGSMLGQVGGAALGGYFGGLPGMAAGSSFGKNLFSPFGL